MSKTSPRVFISYSHDSEDHRSSVLALVQALRRNGVDAWADFFAENDPPKNWPVWMHRQIEQSDYVLVIATEVYGRRFNQEQEVGAGAGVRWEGTLITSDLYFSTDDTTKYIPLLFDPTDHKHIPKPLRLTNVYTVSPVEESTLTQLLRHLLHEPEYYPEPLGESTTVAHLDIPPRILRGANSLVVSALERSETSPRKAIEELTASLDFLRGSQRALAYYVLGQVHQDNGFWSQAMTAYRRVFDSVPSAEVAELAAKHLQAATEVFAARFREGGPVDVAIKCIEAAKRKKKKRMWELLHPTLRLVLVQAWIWANREHPMVEPHDREELAKALAVAKPRHPLASDFLDTQIEEMFHAYTQVDTSDWGAAGNPRPIGIDYELVVLTPTDGDIKEFDDSAGPQPAMAFLMKETFGEWRVANFHPAFPIPGWPPTREEISEEVARYFVELRDSDTVDETEGDG